MITLITGGMRSGKSAYAEKIVTGYDDVVYIATAAVTDDEMKNRIKKHIERRNPKWRTYEAFRNLKNSIGSERFYLLDCVTNLISRILFDITGAKEHISFEDTQNTITDSVNELQTLITGIKKINGNLIMVTNEVGSSIIPMNPIARCFADTQGIVNTKLATLADEVFLTVCGIPIKIK